MFTATQAAEVKLVETVTSIEQESNSWRAVHFHFSQLLDHYRNEGQLKIAVNLISDLLKSLQGGIFVCADGSIFIVCRNATKQLLDKVIFQLRYLFADDPLAYTSEGEENEHFCEIFDLGTRYDDLLDIAKRMVAKVSRGLAKMPRAAVASSSPAASVPVIASAPVSTPVAAPIPSAPAIDFREDPGVIKQFNAARLSSIERDLKNSDLSKVLRRQPVCAAVPNTAIRKVFDELYINIAHLRQLLKVDVDLLSNRWLFKYLTQVLDERMLHMLRQSPARFFDMPVSLNLNVQTLLSHSFVEFDAAIKPATKVSIVIEIQIADVFTDMEAFLVAKSSVQKLGYRVCLDGLTTLSFTQIDRERLGFDLAKLQWNADIASDLKTRDNKKVAEAVKQCGPNRVILCRCDSKQAIDYGQAMGISLFQGRFLDSVVNPTSRIEN